MIRQISIYSLLFVFIFPVVALAAETWRKPLADALALCENKDYSGCVQQLEPLLAQIDQPRDKVIAINALGFCYYYMMKPLVKDDIKKKQYDKKQFDYFNQLARMEGCYDENIRYGAVVRTFTALKFNKQTEEAIALIDKSFATSPEWTVDSAMRLLMLKAKCEQELESKSKKPTEVEGRAEKTYLQAVALPIYELYGAASARNELAEIYIGKKEYSKAVDILNYKSVDPFLGSSLKGAELYGKYYMTAIANAALGNSAAAEKAFSKLAGLPQLNQRDWTRYLEQVNITLESLLLADGNADWKEAAVTFLDKLDVSSQALITLAHYYEKNGDKQRATATYKEIIEMQNSQLLHRREAQKKLDSKDK